MISVIPIKINIAVGAMSQAITSFTILTSLAIITRYVGEVGEVSSLTSVKSSFRYHHSPGSHQSSQLTSASLKVLN